MKHALKLKNMSVSAQKSADSVIEALKSFCSDLGYSADRIDTLECRSRPGFIPYAHNLGNIECVAFGDQEQFYHNGTGFENADATIEKYRSMDIEYAEEAYGAKYADWTEKQRDEFEESQRSDSEATVLFSLDIMCTGFERGIYTFSFRFCVCVKDAPYHRQYDDLIEVEISFRTLLSLERQLQKLMNRADIKQFSECVSESY